MSASLEQAAKKAAAYQAVHDHLDHSFKHIGIGSGSTVVYVVEAIAALGAQTTSSMVFYPTGDQSEDLIMGANLTLGSIKSLPSGHYLDVAFDGADEVDEELNLIKGGGACLFQEKIVAIRAKKFVCVADFRKKSARLGAKWKKGIPLEVLPKAAPIVLEALAQMGSINPQVRSGLPAKAGPIITDNNMWIIDAPFPDLLLAKDVENGSQASNGAKGVWTVDALADKLLKTVGIVEIGLFYGQNGVEVPSGAQKPVAAYFGMEDGTIQVQNADGTVEVRKAA